MGLYSRWVLPWLIDHVTSRPSHTAQRQWLIPQATGEVLEIGFGAGSNLPYYPPEIDHLYAVEPNPGMLRRAKKRLESSPIEVVPVPLIENRNLSLPESSVDCVVSSWTMCSIADLPNALREIHRVLRPGGKLLFVEHGLSPEKQVAHWQNRCNGFNQIIGGGCNLNRDIGAEIRAQPFQMASYDEFYMENTPRLGGFTYRGVAVK